MPRLKTFDTDEALDGAAELFWAKGFEATSIQDLEARMGIQRGSIYHAFGDKQRLFLAALDRYDRVVLRRLADALAQDASGLAAIRHFFRARVDAARGTVHPRGCLITNSAVERAPTDPETQRKVRACLAEIEAAFFTALTRAQQAQEIRATADCRALARFLTNGAQGLAVLARAGVRRGVLADVVRVTLSVLD
jgi:TetR/AcrR family transcriptional regulator, transcriptional repressor for nem operon